MPGDASWISYLADSAAKSSLILACAWALTAALRNASAALRHLIWTTAACSLLAIPAVSLFAPAWDVPVSTVTVAAEGPAFRVQAVALTDLPRLALGDRLPVSAQRAAAAGTAPAAAVRQGWVFRFWATGVLLSVAPLLAGALAVFLRRRGAAAASESAWGGLVPELACALGIRRRVCVLLSGRVRMPVSIGLLNPAVILPADALEWPRDRLRMVLLHELAHVKRRDCVTQALVRLACSLFWFQPLAWFAARQALKERERACDDLVLRAGTRPSDYAGELLHIARSLAAPRWAWGTVSMARPAQLEGRLLAILDERVRRGGLSRAVVLSVVLAAGVAVVPLAAIRPVEAQVPALRAAPSAPNAPAPVAQLPAGSDNEAARLVGQGDLAASQGKPDEALAAYSSAAEAQKKAYGADSIEYATAAVRAARHARAHGDFKRAENLFMAALPVYERVYGPANTEIADICEYLGNAALGSMSADRAREYYKRALDLYTRGGGERGPGVARVTAFLGELDMNSGKPREAEAELTRALALATDNSPDRALALEFYAQLLRQGGRTTEAEKMEAGSLAIRSRNIDQSFGFRVKPQLEVLKVGGDVLPPRPIERPEPRYSEQAWATHYQATAVFSVLIGPDGLIKAATLKRAAGLGLDEKGVEALRGWKFEPATREGKPVTVSATIEVNFRLL